MNHAKAQQIATKHGLGQVYWQFNTAQNTGRQFEVGCIEVKGNTYLRQEDVVAYIREIAGAEETDVRNRLLQAANNIQG